MTNNLVDCNSSVRALNDSELDDVTGGGVPIIIGAIVLGAAAGYQWGRDAFAPPPPPPPPPPTSCLA